MPYDGAHASRAVALSSSLRASATSQEAPAMASPFLSLLVPAYNVEDFLARALDSALSNTECPLEIIVIDDGSSDATLACAQAYAQKDARLRVIAKKNGGYGQALNFAMAQAKGVYLGILEPDDYLVEKGLDEAYAYLQTLEEDALPDILKMPYWRLRREARKSGKREGRAKKEKNAASLPSVQSTLPAETIKHKVLSPLAHAFASGTQLTEDARARLMQGHPSIWSALYKRSFLQAENIFFVEAAGAGWVDGPFALETLLKAKSVVFFDQPLYCYQEDNPLASSAQDITAFAPERFLEMMALQNHLAPNNYAMRHALSVVGLNWFERMMQTQATWTPRTAKKIQEMLLNLSPDDIVEAHEVSPYVRSVALDFCGRDLVPIASGPYYKSLMRRGITELKNNGFSFLLAQGRVLKKRRHRGA